MAPTPEAEERVVMKTKGETFKRNGERWQIGTTTNPMFVKKHPGESGWAVWKETIGGFWLKINDGLLENRGEAIQYLNRLSGRNR